MKKIIAIAFGRKQLVVQPCIFNFIWIVPCTWNNHTIFLLMLVAEKCYYCWWSPWLLRGWTVKEITKSSSTFSVIFISSNIVWIFQLYDTIQMKSNYTRINYNGDHKAINKSYNGYNCVWNYIFVPNLVAFNPQKEKTFGFLTIICWPAAYETWYSYVWGKI